MSNYKVTRIDQTKDPITHFALFLDCDPTTFESCCQRRKVAKSNEWWNWSNSKKWHLRADWSS